MARMRRQSVGAIETPRVVFYMDPSPEQLRHDLLLLSRRISDYNLPLKYSKDYIIEDVKKTFRLERDPVDGSKWPPLSRRAELVPRYGMLQRKSTRRAMYRSVTARNAYRVSKEGVSFNSSRVPKYAGAHQQDDRLPPPAFTLDTIYARAMEIREYNIKHNLPLMRGPELRDKAIKSLKDEHDARQSEGKIPQRRFMGVSAFANQQLQNVFDDWAKDAIIIYKRGGRMIRARRPSL